MPRPPGKITRPFQLFRDLASRARRTQSDYVMRITLVYAERIRVLTLSGPHCSARQLFAGATAPSQQRASLVTAGLSLCFAESASTTKGRHRVPTQNVPRRLRRGMLLRLRNQFRHRRDLGPGSRPSSAATSVSGPVREAACRDLEDSSSCLPLRSTLRAVLTRKRRMTATCPQPPIVEAAQEG